MANPILERLKNRTVTVPFTRDTSAPGFFRSWIETPGYQRRLQQNYDNPDQVRSNRLFALDNLNIHTTHEGSSASAPPTPGSQANVYINPNEPDSVMPHEISHAIGSVDHNKNVGLSDKESSILKQAIIKEQPKIIGSQGSEEEKSSKKEYDNWRHLSQPKEIKADLDATRYQLFKKGVFDITEGKEFKESDLEKAKESLKDDESFKRLLDQVGEENYIQLMNTIASSDSRPSRLFG